MKIVNMQIIIVCIILIVGPHVVGAVGPTKQKEFPIYARPEKVVKNISPHGSLENVVAGGHAGSAQQNEILYRRDPEEGILPHGPSKNLVPVWAGTVPLQHQLYFAKLNAQSKARTRNSHQAVPHKKLADPYEMLPDSVDWDDSPPHSPAVRPSRLDDYEDLPEMEDENHEHQTPHLDQTQIRLLEQNRLAERKNSMRRRPLPGVPPTSPLDKLRSGVQRQFEMMKRTVKKKLPSRDSGLYTDIVEEEIEPESKTSTSDPESKTSTSDPESKTSTSDPESKPSTSDKLRQRKPHKRSLTDRQAMLFPSGAVPSGAVPSGAVPSGAVPSGAVH